MTKLTKCKSCDTEISADAKACPKCGAPNKKKGGCLKLALLGVLVFIALGVITASLEDSGGSSTASSSSKASALQAAMPDDQKAFLEIVQKAQRDARAASNDMARGGILNERSNALRNLATGASAWIGEVRSIDSNSDGKGVLVIKIADGVYVQTWNNAVSDIGSNTLLEPGSDVFNKAAALKRRQQVRFSGHFFRHDETGFNEQSMRLRGKLTEPEFTFYFTSVEGM